MKKKRIVKLEPQTVELFAEVLSKLRPPPPLTVSQWADRYRVLSAESSAEPGRWHTEKAPYQRAIMDAIGDPHVRSVVVMSAAQIGKTDAFILNPLGYYMDYAPCPVMCMQPTLDMGQTLSKDRIAPMIRDTPRLTGLVDTKSRYAGNTVMKKNFPGGHITIVGANSPSSLASRPIKVLLADEIDRYPKSAGTEGDPLDLAKKRQTTFWDYKTVMVSTPTIKGDSRIEDAYLLSTQEEWNVPCPECGAYQPFLWENVKFDKDDLDKGIGYVCRECGCVSNEYRWKEQGKYGKYVAANPGAESRGFHLNTLASTFVGWKEIVTKFIEAKIALDHGNPEQMKVWVNTELGETWEERGIQLEDIELFNRREIYAAEVPDDVLYLTAGVDVQDDRFEVEVVGWGEGTESWGVRYQKIFGDMLSDQVWDDLDNFLLRTWHKADGTAYPLLATCIDSGGHHTDEVYRFAKERLNRRIFAIKGILKVFLMAFPEWLACIFMVVGLVVTALAAVRLGYGLVVAKTVYKWIVNAEEKFGSGAGAEKKAHVIAVLRGYTPDWLDWAINERTLDWIVQLVFDFTKRKLEDYMAKKSAETTTVAHFGNVGENKRND